MKFFFGISLWIFSAIVEFLIFAFLPIDIPTIITPFYLTI